MKYRGIVMVPQIIEFENPGSQAHVENQAAAMLNSFQKVTIGEEVYEAKIMGIYPATPTKPQPLFFDPPPQAA